MARSVHWRRTIPDVVKCRQKDALERTFYILRQMGPTGFVVKEEGQDHHVKVLLIPVVINLYNLVMLYSFPYCIFK